MKNNQIDLKEKNPFHYRVICERCRKTLFFSGGDNGETISVLCDKCTEAMIVPSTKNM